MSNILFQNQPQPMVGLGTMTFTVVNAGLYNVKSQLSVMPFPSAGSGAGSGTGLGSGYGGGAGFNGFSAGDKGLGDGFVGQGFGAGTGYQQPPAYGSNQTSTAGAASGLVITITQNGSTIYTSPTFSQHEFEFQFKQILNCAAADVINIVYSSSVAQDQRLNTVKSTTSIGTGQF